ncbi:divalent-cation tolerance protein CutA [Solirubrobacter sp. CPCC 204708]|nr:divalent-cation tolerance protein CutA [Solirubrobacter deserti]
MLCLVTTPRADAARIADAIVTAREAACVNIVPTVDSVYWWEGKVERDEEALLVVKTTEERLDSLRTLLDEIHPYDVFELVATAIDAGNDAYLRWITASVR